MFKLANTWKTPSTSQTGFPTPGAGAQTQGKPSQAPDAVAWVPNKPTQGRRSFFRPSAPTSAQRGFPSPGNTAQQRAPGSMPNVAIQSGAPIPVTTPYFSRGAAATVQNFGKVLYNPIGAGVVARYRPQASYGMAGQYAASQIFWANQVIPTSINLQGLYDAQELTGFIDSLNIQAVVRTTG